MKIQLIGDLDEQDDGSALATLEVDNEGKLYLMQLGIESLINRYIEQDKNDTSGT